jgi:methionyl-tRNA synthetase
MLDWENGGRLDLLKVGYSLNPPELLFAKIEDEAIAAQMQKLNDNKIQATVADSEKESKITPIKETISFEDFSKIDLRVGKIIEAEKVPKADKLLKLSIDLGFETRTVLSGIAEHYSPEDVLGKLVSVVVNLAPRKMKGIESQGMILMSENEVGKLIFVAPLEDAKLGDEIK